MKHGCEGQGPGATIELEGGAACPFCGGPGPGEVVEGEVEPVEPAPRVDPPREGGPRAQARSAAKERRGIETALYEAHRTVLEALIEGHRGALEHLGQHRVRVVSTIWAQEGAKGGDSIMAAKAWAAPFVGVQESELRVDELKQLPRGSIRVVLSFVPKATS